MRRLSIALFLSLSAALAAQAQFGTPAPDMSLTTAPPVKKFTGTASLASDPFTVQDKWEVCWSGPRKLNISILTPDGTIVAGAAGLRGALFVPKGGIYHLQIDYTPPNLPSAPTPAPGPSALQNTIDGGGNGGSSPDPNNNPQQQQQQHFAEMQALMRARLNRPWEVDVIELNSPAAQRLTQFATTFVVPAIAGGTPAVTAPAPVDVPATAAPTPAAKLTEDQARAVVLITGDKAEGTGFMIKTPEGPAVVTNIHVIANNPNLKITTNTGALVTVLSEKGASDRDLALLAIKDDGYSYFDVSVDISRTVQPGDEVITPGNSQGGEVMLNTVGKILGIGPERIEFDNPIYHGNSGGPVFHTKSGKVLGVVTEAMKVDMSTDLDKASFASRHSAITSSMRYFGLRLDTVSEWVPIDSREFQIETAFLDEFHRQSTSLDSYLNSSDKNQANNSDTKPYLNDQRVMRANASFLQQTAGADTAQRVEALKGLLFDLQNIADLDVTQIQNEANFYSFERDRAREELAYRKALKDELDSIGNNVDRLGSLPHTDE